LIQQGHHITFEGGGVEGLELGLQGGLLQRGDGGAVKQALVRGFGFVVTFGNTAEGLAWCGLPLLFKQLEGRKKLAYRR